MLKQTAYLLAFLLVSFAIFLTAEKIFSPAFEQCIEKRAQENIASSANYQPSGFGSVSAYLGCSGNVIDSHGNGITALATLMIAAFTWTLWIATTKQSE
ncbi:MAG: hypothetical protein ACREQH_08425, partial [Candidatus Binatus sp.]